VLLAGVCATDLQLVAGYMEFSGVPGHEFVGVAESGPFAGRRVVGEINCPCGECAHCRSGRAKHCPERTVLGILGRDGAFAERLVLPQANLHEVPDSIPTEEAVFAEPLAAAFRIPEQVSDLAGQEAVVLGDGRLGNLCAQVLRLHGANVRVAGKHRAKLRVLDQLGFKTEAVATLEHPHSADLVVECTGSPTGLNAALTQVRPMGTIVLKTTVAVDQRVLLASAVIDEVTIIGSRCGPFDKALEALRLGQINVNALIDGYYPLSEALRVFKRASEGQSLKQLFAIDQGTAHLIKQ
jgi:threonine dehydrogenase-like Zn-dependent dehydrogenase